MLPADDHKIVREGLATLLNEQRDIETVGRAKDHGPAYSIFWNGISPLTTLQKGLPPLTPTWP